MNGPLKVIIVGAQKEERRATEKALSFLENTQVVLNQYVGRNMDGNVHSDEFSDKNEEQVIGN